MVCYAEVLFQSSFSLCRSTCCLWNMRLPTRWLGCGLRNGARRTSRTVTVHRLSAYSQDLLFTAHLHDSRLYQAKGAKTCCAHHPCVDRPILYTHNPSWSTLGLHLAHGSGADWLLTLDSRHYIMTSSDELLARMVSLDDERHQPVYSGQPEVAHRLSFCTNNTAMRTRLC